MQMTPAQFADRTGLLDLVVAYHIIPGEDGGEWGWRGGGGVTDVRGVCFVCCCTLQCKQDAAATVGIYIYIAHNKQHGAQ